MNNLKNDLFEIVVVFAEDGTTHLTSISEKTFHSYRVQTNNSIEITEQSGMKILCKVNPRNVHVLQAVKRWQA